VKAVYDALVRRLVLRRQTTDEAMGMLVRCLSGGGVGGVQVTRRMAAALTDQGLRAVSSLRALTFLDLTCCDKVTDEGLRVLAAQPACTRVSQPRKLL
jgi:hypothetical protein